MKDLSHLLNQLKSQLGLNQIQSGLLATPLTIDFYEKWLGQNFHGEMAYLKDHFIMKQNPKIINTELRTVITITQSYFPTVEPASISVPARTALYSQNKDYHYWLKDKLKLIIETLKENFPEQQFFPYVDSGPILERNWAYENGMGWFGKNTCLIHPQHGSLFFIAEILTTLPAPQEKIEPLPDFCGTCRKCIEICPTSALVAPQTMKADLCISYLTIESKTNPPIQLREKIGDWFFGCDLCQTICPWNEKVFRKLELKPSNRTSTSLQLELNAGESTELTEFFRFILSSSNKKIEKHFYGSAMLRAGGNGLKRNAMIVIANRKMTNLQNDVATYADHPKLGELAEWCLKNLAN